MHMMILLVFGTVGLEEYGGPGPVAYLGFHKGGQSFPSLPSPSPSLPFPPFPPLPFPSPPLPLEVGSLIAARGSGGAL